ncbi:MAG: hypothetical protein KKF46_01515 [Nanoarchaeota archaeon]|nr:hypothetical protein [Nanoarchaeota archaeon]MBU1321010.1 hypothetical protein [Nanoarchaeota archaeon]MBU1597520.1 hypothetical protein [Nanoarchaeota archaeon]MBU2441673.1 hypothetical protein [Nanoarchaeota archaeon]
MAKVIITESLFKQIQKKFSAVEAEKIINTIESLEGQPKKGKLLSSVGGVVIKELKYQKYRFYFITDGHIIKFGSEDELANLLIKFVAMSEKKDQQKKIDKIKEVLKSMGFDSFK